MPTCANCDREAAWGYEPIVGFITNYCKTHLPSFLRNSPLIKDLELERHLNSGTVAPSEEDVAKASRSKKPAEKVSEEKEATA
jgi:hypothetical protein